MSEDRGEKRPRPRGKRPRRKVCDFCVNKIEYIDYKDVNRLRRSINEPAISAVLPCGGPF